MLRKLIGASVVMTMIVAGVAAADPPENDAFADANALAEGVEQGFVLTESTDEGGEGFCDGENTIWYSFAAPAAGDYVTWVTGSNFDSEIGWFSDIATSSADCPDDSDWSYDAIETPVTLAQGELQYVQISHHDDLQERALGQGSVGVARVEAADDDFADASPLEFREGAETAVKALDLDGSATTEVGENTTCGTDAILAETAWLTFTPPTSRTWMIELKAYTFFGDGHTIGVYSGSSVDDVTLLGCSTARPAVSLDLDAGSTYHIQVGGPADAAVVRAEPAGVRGLPVVIDTDGDGTATATGDFSDLVFDGSENPVIFYTDDTNAELRAATRSAGGWTDELVDDDGAGASTVVGDWVSAVARADGSLAAAYEDTTDGSVRIAIGEPGAWSEELVDDDGPGTSTVLEGPMSLIEQSDGRLAVAYHDSTDDTVRFAVRSAGGVWSDFLVDADGDGTSLDLDSGRNALAELPNGDLVIAYVDIDDDTIRLATSTDGGMTWTDELVWTETGPDDPYPPFVTVDQDGTLWIITEQENYGIVVLSESDGTWTEGTDAADHDLAELPAGEIIGVTTGYEGDLMIAWNDDNYDSGVAISRLTGEGWIVHDLAPYSAPVGSPEFEGFPDFALSGGGIAMTPDDRIMVSLSSYKTTQGGYVLTVIEDSLDVDAGADASSPAARSVVVDGSGTVDGWGDVASWWWSVPGGCHVRSTEGFTADVWCYEPTSSKVKLHVTDADGWTNWDYLWLDVSAPECDLSPDPFVDVAATSFARDSVTCIYNLGVTTGTSPTTYSPADFVTREQMAAFLARMYVALKGKPCPETDIPFTDVVPSSFAFAAIRCIFDLEVTTGTSATTYSPADFVTREQMASFIARLWKAIHGSNAPIVATPFDDVSDSSFAKDDIGRIFGLEITTGTSPTTYSPGGFVTREQMAAFLERFYVAELT